MAKKRSASPTSDYVAGKRQKTSPAPRRPLTRARKSLQRARIASHDSTEDESSATEEPPAREESPTKEELPDREESPASEESPAKEEEEESAEEEPRRTGAKRKFRERSSSDPPATVKLGTPNATGRPYILVPRRRQVYAADAPTTEAPALKAPMANAPTLNLSTEVAVTAKAATAKAATTKAATAKAATTKAATAKAATTKAATAKAATAKSATAKAMKGNTKGPTAKVAGARARNATAVVIRTPTPEPAPEPRPHKRPRLERSSDQVGSDEDDRDEFHPLFEVECSKPVHSYKFANFVYYSNLGPVLGYPGPVEELTTWREPGTEDFVPPPPHTVVPRRARDQFDRSLKYLYPPTDEQGRADGAGVDADEIVKGVDGKKKVDKGKGKAVDDEPVDEGNLAQEGVEDQEQRAWSCEPLEEVIKVDKGKGKEVDVVEDSHHRDVVITMANGQVIVDNDAVNRGGRPSNLFSDDCDVGTVEIEAILERISTTHNKKMSLVHDNVGYGPVHAEHRAPSAWTGYQRLYAIKVKRPEGQSNNDRLRECRDSYYADIDGMSVEDLETFKVNLFKLLAEEIAKMPKVSIGSRIKAAEKALFKCIHGISAEDPEIQIFSGIVYVGEDPAGLQLPGRSVLSSKLMMKVASKLSVNTLLNQATGLARGEYASASVASAVNGGGSKESAMVATSSTTAKPIKAPKVVKTESTSVASKSAELARRWGRHQLEPFKTGRLNFPWASAPTWALRFKFRVVWPATVLVYPGGPGFQLKQLVARHWAILASGLTEADFETDGDTSHLKFYLEAWTKEEKEFWRGSTDYLRIPLVITNTGIVLVTVRDTLAVAKDDSDEESDPGNKPNKPSAPFIPRPNIPSKRPLSPTAVRTSHNIAPLRSKGDEFVQGSSKSHLEPRDRSSLRDVFDNLRRSKIKKEVEYIDVDMEDVELQTGIEESLAKETRKLASRGDLGQNQYTGITYSNRNRPTPTVAQPTRQTASYSGTSTQRIPQPTRQVVSYSGHSSSHTLPARAAVDDIFSNPINRGPPSNRIHNRVPSQARLMNSSPIESGSSPSTSRINPLRFILPDFVEEDAEDVEGGSKLRKHRK